MYLSRIGNNVLWPTPRGGGREQPGVDRAPLTVPEVFRRDGDTSLDQAGPTLSTAQRRVMTRSRSARAPG